MSQVESTDGESPRDEESLATFRQWLVAAEQRSQELFDKTVLTLSGGALGVSFIFLRDVIGSEPVNSPQLLFGAWLAWALSTSAVLLSYYLSHLALRKAIDQVDRKELPKGGLGGAYAKATGFANLVGALLFLAGVCLITAFAYENLPNLGARDGARQEAPADPQRSANQEGGPGNRPTSASSPPRVSGSDGQE